MRLQIAMMKKNAVRCTLRRVSEAEEYEFSTADHMIKKSRLTSGMIHDIE